MSYLQMYIHVIIDFVYLFKDYKILEFVKCTDKKMDVSCGICGLNALK